MLGGLGAAAAKRSQWGVSALFGLTPVSGKAHKLGSQLLTWENSNFFTSLVPRVTDSGDVGGMSSFLWPAFTLGATGISTGSAFMEEGLWGAAKSIMYDANVAAASYQAAHYNSMGQFIKQPSMASYGMRGIGAAIGASVVGSAFSSVPVIGEPLGYVLGSSMGAAPMRFLGKHPVVAGGAVAVGAAVVGTRLAMRGTYEVLRHGYETRQASRGIDTAGDLSAFMTQAAFTQRERGVQAMQNSHMNARSALGREASYLSYPQRSYFSRYRQGY